MQSTRENEYSLQDRKLPVSVDTRVLFYLLHAVLASPLALSKAPHEEERQPSELNESLVNMRGDISRLILEMILDKPISTVA